MINGFYNIKYIVSKENGKYYKADPKSEYEKKQIKKSEFDKILKKKVGKTKATKIKYYKNTKKNRDKYLK